MSRYAPLWTRTLPALAAITASAALAGCVTGGYDTFAYHEIHEIPKGPGLITDDGEYTIISRDWTSSGTSQGTQAAQAPAVHTSSGITEAATPE
jgi:hypothetical protein